MTKKKTTESTTAEAKKLYEMAARVKDLAPWQWMEESQLFGVKNPETGELGFVSIMGMAGEHYAVSLYRGAEGLHGFWEMEEAAPMADPQMLLNIPQLQASFEDRDQTEKQDRELIKQLGLKFRGAKAWPLFRSYASGYMPWFLTPEETRFLTVALEQTLEVAPRVKANPDLLWGDNDSVEGDYLVRVSHEENGRLVWQDVMMEVSEPELARVEVMMDMDALAHLKGLAPSPLVVETDFFTMPTPVRDKGERPYFPTMLMLVEASRGMILGFEMMPPGESREALWGQIPAEVVRKLAELGVRPREIHVGTELMENLLRAVGHELNCPIRLCDELPGLDDAQEGLRQLAGGGLW